MGVLNKRNAVLGWAVWTVSKRAAKRKARSAAGVDSSGPGKGVVATALAAAGGALWFWRRRRSGSVES